MRLSTRATLDAWYGETFDLRPEELWTRVTARPHRRLHGQAGYYVAWRGSGVHVSVPTTAEPAAVRRIISEPVEVLQQLDYWEVFAAGQGLHVVGPSTHGYLDAPGLAEPVGGAGRSSEAVREIDRAVLPGLQALVAADEWVTSGWTDAPAHRYGLFRDGSLVAAANLNAFAGAPRDVGVLVARDRRGEGLSEIVGRHAATCAIKRYGFARWGARNANGASLAISRRLGFERWCTQLWVR